MEVMRNECAVLIGKPDESISLARCWRGLEDNIKVGLGEIGLGSVDWIHLAQYRDRCQALVKTVVNLLAP
jgi:hypothetical protein